MLAIEVTEIGATLVALSVPGVKPIVDKLILRRDVTGTYPVGTSQYGGKSRRRDNTALRSISFRTRHDGETILTDGEMSAEEMQRFKNGKKSSDGQSDYSTNGILVHMDFKVKEDNRSMQV